MVFILTRSVGGGPHAELPLTEHDFRAAVEAKRGLYASLWVEEKLAMALENYAEFEGTLLDQAVRVAIFREFSNSALQDRLYTAIRRLSNVLSACRAYIDQAKHDIAGIYGSGSEMGDAIERAFSREYDSRLGYRTMEAIRNYAQHRSMPLHVLSATHDRVDSATPTHRIMSVPRIRLADLEADPKFKSAVLLDLKMSGQTTLDLRPLLRDYIQGLGTAHTSIRALMAPDIIRWEAAITGLIERWQTETASDISGLAIMRRDEDGKDHETEDLFEAFMERRRELVARIDRVTSVGRAFVSNEEGRK